MNRLSSISAKDFSDIYIYLPFLIDVRCSKKEGGGQLKLAMGKATSGEVFRGVGKPSKIGIVRCDAEPHTLLTRATAGSKEGAPRWFVIAHATVLVHDNK